MDIASRLLDRLDGVRQSAANRWIARCPAHKDRSPSLSIACTRDGLMLVHCHAGCEFEDICHAVGLEPSDLFPPRAVANYVAAKSDCNISPAEAFVLVQHEVQTMAILAAALEPGGRFSDVAADRFHTAMGRINETYRRVRSG